MARVSVRENGEGLAATIRRAHTIHVEETPNQCIRCTVYEHDGAVWDAGPDNELGDGISRGSPVSLHKYVSGGLKDISANKTRRRTDR